MLIQEQLQESIRDWIVLILCAASFLWTSAGRIAYNNINSFTWYSLVSLSSYPIPEMSYTDKYWVITAAACFLIVRGRNMIFNRLWRSRLLLAINGFLWPGSFVLSTQQFAWSVDSPNWETDLNCQRFTLLVYAILEPTFCLLVVLHVRFDSKICLRIPCLSPTSRKLKREELPSAISGNCICFSCMLLLLPSIAYHLSWIFLASSSPWYANEQPPIGPCKLPLENLLGVTAYVAGSLLFINIYTRRCCELFECILIVW